MLRLTSFRDFAGTCPVYTVRRLVALPCDRAGWVRLSWLGRVPDENSHQLRPGDPAEQPPLPVADAGAVAFHHLDNILQFQFRRYADRDFLPCVR